MTKKNIAYALVRVSTNEQETKTQRKKIIKVASELGYTIPDDDDHVFGEKISGYDEYTEDRKSIVELKKHLQSTRELPSAIFCSEVSRLSRNSIKVPKYVQELSLDWKIPMYFMDLKVWTIFIDGNRAGQEDRYAIQEIVGAAKEAERERDRIRERTKTGRDAKAADGYYVGHLVDGYTWKEGDDGEKYIIKDKQREEVINRIFKLYIEDGYTTKKIAQILNSENIPTPQHYRALSKDPAFKGYKDISRTNRGISVLRSSMRWTSSAISNTLRNTWYRGIRKFNKGEYPVDPYITQEDSKRVEARSIETLQSKSNATHFYLLSNILFCGHCGRKMYGHYGGSQNHYYCSSKETGNDCGCIGINKENIEAIVWDVVKRYIGGTYAFSMLRKDLPQEATDIINRVQTTFDLKQNQNRISSEIENLKRTMIDNQTEIDRLNLQIEYYLQQESEPDCSEKRRQLLRKNEAEAETQIQKIEKEQAATDTKLVSLRKRLDVLKSSKEIMKKYLSSDNLDTIKQIVSATVESVILFNVNKSIKIIRVIFIDGYKEESIYSSYLLNKKVIHLFNWDYNENENCLYPHINPNALSKNGTRTIDYKLPEGMELSNDLSMQNGKVDVRDYILWNREKEAIPYTTLEQPTEKNLMYREREKEYRKKHRNGKIALPHNRITKDEQYLEYVKERRKLYHRREKIKKAKRKSEQEKEKELRVISERLIELRSALKWYNLYTDEVVKQHERVLHKDK